MRTTAQTTAAMRPLAYIAIIAALITATESAMPSYQDPNEPAPIHLLNEALLEAIKASSESAPSSMTTQVRKGAAQIHNFNTNNEEMGMLKVAI